jgi:hypothetical protein
LPSAAEFDGRLASGAVAARLTINLSGTTNALVATRGSSRGASKQVFAAAAEIVPPPFVQTPIAISTLSASWFATKAVLGEHHMA